MREPGAIPPARLRSIAETQGVGISEIKESNGFGNTTPLTFSVPLEIREFFVGLTAAGFNRMVLMVKMIKILRILYQDQKTYPGGLHKAADHLMSWVRLGNLERALELEKEKPIPDWSGLLTK